MVLQPGESTTVSMDFTMKDNMGGMHNFRLHLPTNDPTYPDQTVSVLSNWLP
jgi:hypothetical protein